MPATDDKVGSDLTSEQSKTTASSHGECKAKDAPKKGATHDSAVLKQGSPGTSEQP